MKRYRVKVPYVTYYIADVKARNEEEALEKFFDVETGDCDEEYDGQLTDQDIEIEELHDEKAT